ncbi:MAG: hypothetical protein OXH31_09685 [Gammaproteobacteria bacterium]|nr:hypothetical protein [Gammaproteobacteria bacterium]
MTTYLISYDLNEGSNDHGYISETLRNTYKAEKFLKLTTTWVIDCGVTMIEQVDNFLRKHLQKSGSLFIIPFGVDVDQFDFCSFVKNGETINPADITFVLGFNRA